MVVATMDKSPDLVALQAAARYYAGLGYRVFPLMPGSTEPLDPDGPAGAASDVSALVESWAQEPRANIGIATGEGLLALEADPEDGLSSLVFLMEEWELPDGAPEAKAPDGGAVLFFTVPEGFGFHGRREPFPGITVHGEGSYVAAPPTVQPQPDGDAAGWRWVSPFEAVGQVPELPAVLALLFNEADPHDPCPTVPSFSAPGGKTYEDLLRMPVARAVVEGLLWPGTLNLLFGESQVGKTFTALSLAMHLEYGLPLFGLHTARTPVYYVAQEGQRNLAARLQALHERMGRRPSFQTWTAPFYLDDSASLGQFVEWCIARERGVIVVDTLAKVLGRLDVDNNRDAGLALQALRTLVEHGHTVLLIGHPGHSNRHRPAGARTWENGMDTILRVTAKRQGLVVSTFKNRDGDKHEYSGRLVPVRFVSRQSGEVEVSLVFEPHEKRAVRSTENPQVADSTVLIDPRYVKALHVLAGLPESATNKQWLDAHNDPQLSDSTFKRLRDNLDGDGFLNVTGARQKARYAPSEKGLQALRDHGVEVG